MKRILMLMMVLVVVLDGAVCDMLINPKNSYEEMRGVKVEEIEKVLAPDWRIELWKEDGTRYEERMQNGAEITSAVWYWDFISLLTIITDKMNISYSVSRQSNIRDNKERGYLLYVGEDGDNYLWDIYLNEENETISVDMLREVEIGGKKKLVCFYLFMNITRFIPLDTDLMIWLRDCIWDEGKAADRYRKSIEELYWRVVDLSRSGAR